MIAAVLGPKLNLFLPNRSLTGLPLGRQVTRLRRFHSRHIYCLGRRSLRALRLLRCFLRQLGQRCLGT